MEQRELILRIKENNIKDHLIMLLITLIYKVYICYALNSQICFFK
jgi:hypothetical protein